MNPDTGEVRKFASREEAVAAGFTVPIDDPVAEKLLRVIDHNIRSNFGEPEEFKLATQADLSAEHTGLMRFFAGATRFVKGARRGFSAKFFTKAKGSFWKPGAEHLPTGGPSRQVRRRAAHLEARALARQKVKNRTGIREVKWSGKKEKPGYKERDYIGTFDAGAGFSTFGFKAFFRSDADPSRAFGVLRATGMAQARRKFRDLLKGRPVNIELMPADFVLGKTPAPLQGAGI